MAKKDKDIRPIIKMKSTAGTGFTYVTKKNRRNDPDRLAVSYTHLTLPTNREV